MKKTKFKLGDKVKIVRNEAGKFFDQYIGEVGYISYIFHLDKYPYDVHEKPNEEGRYLGCWGASELELVKPDKPKKEKPVKYIAVFDEVDQDPHKTFTTKKDLLAWLEEAKEDGNIIWDSIIVYKIAKILEPKVNIRVRLFESVERNKMTKSKKIEKIKLDKDGNIFLRLEPIPDDEFLNVKELVNKLNEIIDAVNSLSGKGK